MLTNFSVNGSPVVTVSSPIPKPSVSSTVSQVKMTSGIQVGAQPPVQLPSGTGNQSQKPVMRVSPLTGQHVTSDGVVFSTGMASHVHQLCTLLTPVNRPRIILYSCL